ncbi:uncharacterized LOC110117498 homolog [Tupaia chinensis]|uniref:uncharacterized LOC110117498 homolog n=1 Tax=Tupaia chinensis TaxID=246437 RepID=UPI000FFB1F2C|nr:uncharacterized LOC110117498 homolog [Tupaia chinensis]
MLMGPSRLLKAPRPRGMNFPCRRPGMGWPQPPFPKMFKCSRRRYQRKPQGPPATIAATTLAAMSADINTYTAAPSMWILPSRVLRHFCQPGSFLIL